MNSAMKNLLILLAAPILLAVFLLLVPLLLIFLLFFALFIPSGRIFHFSRPPYDGKAEREAAGEGENASGEEAVYDVECTVVETSEESETPDAEGQPPKLKS